MSLELTFLTAREPLEAKKNKNIDKPMHTASFKCKHNLTKMHKLAALKELKHLSAIKYTMQLVSWA